MDFQAVFAELKKGGFVGGPLMIETLTLNVPLVSLSDASHVTLSNGSPK